MSSTDGNVDQRKHSETSQIGDFLIQSAGQHHWPTDLRAAHYSCEVAKVSAQQDLMSLLCRVEDSLRQVLPTTVPFQVLPRLCESKTPFKAQVLVQVSKQFPRHKFKKLLRAAGSWSVECSRRGSGTLLLGFNHELVLAHFVTTKHSFRWATFLYSYLPLVPVLNETLSTRSLVCSPEGLIWRFYRRGRFTSVKVTEDPRIVLKLLDLPWDRYRLGFLSKLDLYEFLSSGCLFNDVAMIEAGYRPEQVSKPRETPVGVWRKASAEVRESLVIPSDLLLRKLSVLVPSFIEKRNALIDQRLAADRLHGVRIASEIRSVMERAGEELTDEEIHDFCYYFGKHELGAYGNNRYLLADSSADSREERIVRAYASWRLKQRRAAMENR